MKRILIVLVLVLSTFVQVEAVELRTATPNVLRTGEAIEVTLTGGNLWPDKSERPRLWTSFAAETEFVVTERHDRNRVQFRIKPAAGVRLGRAALRLTNSQGISHPLMIWLDELDVAKSENRFSREMAQELKHPVAISGVSPDRRSLFYRFQLVEGEVLDAELLAARLGSEMDGVLALFDEGGRELLAVDDDPVIGADCRLHFVAPTAGNYVLSLNDVQYRNGKPFLLRVCSGTHAQRFPLGATRGQTLAYQMLKPDGSVSSEFQLPCPADADGGLQTFTVPGQTFGISLFVSSGAQSTEQEPNDAVAESQPLSIPAAVSGCFQQRRDVDTFSFKVEEEEELTFRALTRTLGSPSYVRVRVRNEAGAIVFDSREAGIQESTQRFKVPGGAYSLVVTDLLSGHGPTHVYHFVLERASPFSLSTNYQNRSPHHRPIVTPGGFLQIPVKVQRHGYDGQITLGTTGDTGGFRLTNQVVAEKRNDTNLRIHVPETIPVGSLLHFQITATAEIDGRSHATTLPTRELLKQDFPKLATLPADVGGTIAAGVVANTYSWEPPEVRVGVAATAKLPVKISWQSDRREDINFSGSQLPAGCRIEKTKNLNRNTTEAEFSVVCDEKAKPDEYHIFLEATGRIEGHEFRRLLPVRLAVFQD